MVNKKLKNIVHTEEYRVIEQKFIKKAEAVKDARIDRTLTYEEQGRQSHVNELAYKTIMAVVNMVRREIEIKFKNNVNWE